jgi:hypothetical protein
MARGWESKSVEEQMANALEQPAVGLSNGYVSEERAARRTGACSARTPKQSLNLQRESILSQRTSNPGRRAALEAAGPEIEAQISLRWDSAAPQRISWAAK